MPAGGSPAARRVGEWRVGGELFGALGFTFLRGTFLRDEASLPRRGRKSEGLLVHDVERTFRLDSN